MITEFLFLCKLHLTQPAFQIANAKIMEYRTAKNSRVTKIKPLLWSILIVIKN